MCVESQQLPDINLATKLLCYLLIHQGSQQKDVSTAADDVRTSAGAKSQNHLNKSTVYMYVIKSYRILLKDKDSSAIFVNSPDNGSSPRGGTPGFK